jgi:hypothetical protein
MVAEAIATAVAASTSKQQPNADAGELIDFKVGSSIYTERPMEIIPVMWLYKQTR